MVIGATAVTGIGYAHTRPTRSRAGVVPGLRVSVGGRAVGRPIPVGFLGLSIEYWAAEAYAGKDPAAINPALVQLIRNLSDGQRMVLRIGGDSTDRTWWPVSHSRRPKGVNYSLDPRRLAVLGALAGATDARMILGINLEADSRRVAGAEARAMLAGIGRSRILALELGNEPELYGNSDFPFYVKHGDEFTGRAATYDMAAFTRDFSRIGASLPPVPLAGPTSGGHGWLGELGVFAANEPRLRLMTVHRYPFQACYISPRSPIFPTIGRLLSPVTPASLADSVGSYLAVAHGRHLALRIDEMNNVSCGDPPGVPDTFAMALWVLETLFADASVGVDGVNIHTYPGAVYQLFRFWHANSGWRALVEPEYYGLLLFAQAAPPGARLIETSARDTPVRVWATRDPRGTVRVVLINDDVTHRHLVAVRVAGAGGPATLERLLATSAHATRGVRLGGQSFGSATETGRLSGALKTARVTPAGGRYVISLPSASAALITLRSR